MGSPKTHSWAQRAPGKHKTTHDSNKLQLLHHREKPDTGDLHGLSNPPFFPWHFLAGILIPNLTSCYIL